MDVRDHPFKVTPGFILFSEGWRAEFVPLRLRIFKIGYRTLVKPLRQALQRVFVENGVTVY